MKLYGLLIILLAFCSVALFASAQGLISGQATVNVSATVSVQSSTIPITVATSMPTTILPTTVESTVAYTIPQASVSTVMPSTTIISPVLNATTELHSSDVAVVNLTVVHATNASVRISDDSHVLDCIALIGGCPQSSSITSSSSNTNISTTANVMINTNADSSINKIIDSSVETSNPVSTNIASTPTNEMVTSNTIVIIPSNSITENSISNTCVVEICVFIDANNVVDPYAIGDHLLESNVVIAANTAITGNTVISSNNMLSSNGLSGNTEVSTVIANEIGTNLNYSCGLTGCGWLNSINWSAQSNVVTSNIIILPLVSIATNVSVSNSIYANLSCDTWHSCNIYVNSIELNDLVQADTNVITANSYVIVDPHLNTTISLSNSLFNGITISANIPLGLQVASNSALANDIIKAYIPPGFTAINDTLNTTVVLSQAHKTNDTTFISVEAESTPTSSTVNISSIKHEATNKIISSTGGVANLLTSTYLNLVFNNTDVVQKQSINELNIIAGIHDNASTVRYIPSNVTVYGAKGKEVIAMTNMVSGIENIMNLSSGTSEFKSIELTLKDNFSDSAIAIDQHNSTASAGCTTLLCWHNHVQDGSPPANAPGITYSYIYVNGSIPDSKISEVEYTFNVSKQWLIQNKLNVTDIKLFRANVSSQEWEELNTTLVATNSTNYFYTAISPGMSLYAIGAYAPSTFAASQPTTTIQTANTTAPLIANPYSHKTTLWIILAIVAILIIIAIALIAKRFWKCNCKDPEHQKYHKK